MNPATPVTTQIVTITPTEAEALLKTNTLNRKVRSSVVARYARDMTNKDWRLNGEGIKVSDTGELLDGQHRLLACVEANVSFQTILVIGLEFDSRETVDTGARRNFSDILRWHGETGTAGLAAAIESSMLWDESGTPMHIGITHSNHERLAWLEANPDIREALRMWRFGQAPLKFPISVGGPFLMRAMRLSETDARAFVESLGTGENLDQKHPIYNLRSWLLNMATRRGRPPREEYAAIGVKAWNAYNTGRPVQRLAWRRGGATPESFPEMLGPDGRSYEEFLTDPIPQASGGVGAITEILGRSAI